MLNIFFYCVIWAWIIKEFFLSKGSVEKDEENIRRKMKSLSQKSSKLKDD